MIRQSAAIAVFVKTPGFSPIKTRLAAGLGSERSQTFYRLSVEAIAATVSLVRQSTGAAAYWAVAEDEALSDPLWEGFPRIAQGLGGLGNRLDRVLTQLGQLHRVVVALGADSPQLGFPVLELSLRTLLDDQSRFSHVLGRSHDGGFYLFASRKQLASTVWSQVSYSTETTAEDLARQLAPSGEVLELERLTDVDEVADLSTLRGELLAIHEPTQPQLAVLHWIEQGCPAEPNGY